MTNILRRVKDVAWWTKGLTVAAGASLFAMMVMMTVHVVSRKLGHPVPGAFELSEQLMLVVFAFPLAEVARRKDHIRFEVFANSFSPAVSRRMDVAGTLVGLLVFAPLAFEAWQIAVAMYAMGEYRQGMVNVPIWPFRALLAVGLTAFSAYLLARAIAILRTPAAGTSRSTGEDSRVPPQAG